MKSLLTLLLIFTFLPIVKASSAESDDASKCIRDHAWAENSGDINKILPFISHSSIDKLKKFSSNYLDLIQRQAILLTKNKTLSKVEVIKMTFEGPKCYAISKFTYKDGSSSNMSINLVKENEAWRIGN